MSSKAVVSELAKILEDHSKVKAPRLLPTIRAIGSVADEKYLKRLDLWDQDYGAASFPDNLSAEEDKIADVAFLISDIINENLYCGYRESEAIKAYDLAIKGLRGLGICIELQAPDLSKF